MRDELATLALDAELRPLMNLAAIKSRTQRRGQKVVLQVGGPGSLLVLAQPAAPQTVRALPAKLTVNRDGTERVLVLRAFWHRPPES